MRFEPDRTLLESDVALLPSRFVWTFPVLEVETEGEKGLLFLLDTGAANCMVDSHFAERHRERRVDPGAKSTVTDTEGVVRPYRDAISLGQVRSGGLHLTGVNALVKDLSENSIGMGCELAGILGMPAFAHVTLSIDYGRQQVRVSKAPIDPKASNVVRIDGRDATPRMNIRVGGHEVAVMIDTGSNETVVIPEARRGEFAWAVEPRAYSTSINVHGRSMKFQQFGRLADDLEIAGHIARRPIASVASPGGRIGGNLMEHFRVDIDWRRDRARFVRESKDPIVFPPWRGNGAGMVTVEGRTKVIDFVPGSPTDRAGVRVGDEVLAHAGPPLDALGVCGEWHRLERTFDGELFCVRRDGATRHFRLENVDLIP